jgi:[NiFe] hydrogenase assembly HybE family chaperone
MHTQATGSPAAAAPLQARGPQGFNNTVAVQARVAQLEQVFAHIGATRMHGVPVLNKALRVQAVGFEVVDENGGPDGRDEGDAQVLLGILITPWFMNLLRLPLVPGTAVTAASSTTSATTSAPASATISAGAPGSKRSHLCGEQLFEFIAAHEDALGSFEACSLFSPMFEFADQAGAVSTATEVLKLLRTPSAKVAATKQTPSQATIDGASTSTPVNKTATLVSTSAPSSSTAPVVPSRRGFLLGRVRPGAVP